MNTINRTFEGWYTSKKVTEITTLIGNTGYGKSYLAGLIEEINTKKSYPFGVIDKQGIHYVIREKFDEVIIIGGEHGDYSLDEIDEVIPMIYERGYSYILDVSDLDEIFAQEFVGDFFTWAYDWHRENRKPRNYIIEECDAFLGQTGSLKYCKDIITRCITKGRMNGFGFTLISQRFRMIDKTPLGQTRNYIIFNMKLTNDLTQLKQLVGEDVSHKVRRLKEGQCLIMTDEGHSTYKVGERECQSVAGTPEIGVELVEVKLLELNKEIKGVLEQ